MKADAKEKCGEETLRFRAAQEESRGPVIQLDHGGKRERSTWGVVHENQN